jgi:hypothetical protein
MGYLGYSPPEEKKDFPIISPIPIFPPEAIKILI